MDARDAIMSFHHRLYPLDEFFHFTQEEADAMLKSMEPLSKHERKNGSAVQQTPTKRLHGNLFAFYDPVTAKFDSLRPLTLKSGNAQDRLAKAADAHQTICKSEESQISPNKAGDAHRSPFKLGASQVSPTKLQEVHSSPVTPKPLEIASTTSLPFETSPAKLQTPSKETPASGQNVDQADEDRDIEDQSIWRRFCQHFLTSA